MDKHAMHLKLTKLLSVGRETERTEFKVDNSNPQEIGEYISSLSNAACLHDVPKGYLIYGVENQTCDVVGTNFQPRKTKKGGEELENWLARHLDPRVHFSIEEIVFQEKRVVVFEIEAARTQPVKFKGKPYIRVGTCQQNLDAHPGKERKIWINASQSRFEDGVAMEDVLAEDITEYLNWDSYFRLLKHRMPRDLDVILETLTREKLIRESGSRYHITNLGAILFARDLDQFGPLARKAVRVIIYRGNDRLKTVKEQIGRFGYAVGFEGLVTFITDRLPSNEEIGKIFRKDIKMYPELAIRELVANALIHQDFKETGCGPMVEIFNGRIEISNPGVPLIDTLRFIDHPPQSRNEVLAAFMRRINVCEERGSGIDKVVSSVETYQLPAPEFVVASNSLRVTLSAYKSLRQMSREDKIRACYQHCALKYVAGEYMSNVSLRERLRVEKKNYSVISRIISDTIRDGLVKQSNPESTSKKLARYVPFWA